MEVEGKIKLIGQTETVGNGFTKRQLVVTTNETYPQHLSIEFVKDKTSILDSYNVGQDVKVSINLRGREWTSPAGEVKFFNSIQGWRIEALQAAMPQGQPPAAPSDPSSWPTVNDAPKAKEDFDDLPF